jgi:integrase
MTDDRRDPRDHHIWRSRGGMLYFKIGVPPKLRHHFRSETGKPKPKLTESLGTDSFVQARILRDQRLAHWQQVFARLEAGAVLSPEETATEQHRIRHSTLQALLVEPSAPLIPEEEKLFEAMQAAVKARRPMIEPSIRYEVMDEARRIADEKFGPGVIANGSPEWNEICQQVAAAKAKALEDYLIRMFRGEPPVESSASVVPTAAPAPVNNGNGNGGNLERFSVALGHYLEWLREVRKARPATISDYKQKAECFVKFANDPSLGVITIEQAKEFLKHVAETQGVVDATVNLYQSVCRMVIDHARTERHRFVGENPFEFRKRKAEAKSKAKFTVDELNKLFGSPTFTDREIKPKVYGVASALPWVTLISLYSGASLEEIAQLRPQDIEKAPDDGWVINILPEAALSGALKRPARKRIIPLHPELERLGLLKYRRSLPKDATRLFPGLPVPTNGKDKLGGALGKAFGRWRKKLGIEREGAQLDFHSLRHTFTKALEDTGCAEADADRITGHSHKGLTFGLYSAPELKRIAPFIARVAWPGLRIK